MRSNICTFFRHSMVPKEIEPTLRSTLIDLIENKDVKMFYVGNHGQFDGMVHRTLCELSSLYPISYNVVLAYMPQKRDNSDMTYYSDTILPDGVETVPKRFAISYRNKWMIQKSDYVVTYVTHDLGSGAAQFKKIAEKKRKKVIELSKQSTMN